MKQTSLLSLLVALVLGGVVIADQKGAVRNDSGEDVPNPIAEKYLDEPLFLRGRNNMLQQCAPCDKGRIILDGEVDLRAFETFNAQFMNLRDH